MTLTLDTLKKKLIYDPETGYFTRLSTGKIITRVVSKKKPYIQVFLDGKEYLGHRLAWFYMTGSWPQDEIDHEDLDKSNNRWSNLRPATRIQNASNIQRTKRNSSGYKGVHFNKRAKKFTAQIGFKNKLHYLGYFDSAEEAAQVYNDAAIRLHKEFAITN